MGMPGLPRVRTALEEAEWWWQPEDGLPWGYRMASTELQFLGLAALGWALCYTGAPAEVHAHG